MPVVWGVFCEFFCVLCIRVRGILLASRSFDPRPSGEPPENEKSIVRKLRSARHNRERRGTLIEIGEEA
eukprot:9185777-Pyramimonas_sp.AAC.1